MFVFYYIGFIPSPSFPSQTSFSSYSVHACILSHWLCLVPSLIIPRCYTPCNYYIDFVSSPPFITPPCYIHACIITLALSRLFVTKPSGNASQPSQAASHTLHTSSPTRHPNSSSLIDAPAQVSALFALQSTPTEASHPP